MSMLSGLNITLIVSGSIAAYKSAEIVRELTKRQCRVRTILTRAGAQFITPLTLQTLTGYRVTTDMFDEVQEGTIGHISLADEADLVLVAPASANLIARAANGIADDIAAATLLATRAPVIMAPAMNVNMWDNPVTQENIDRLKARGVTFIGPAEGELACGWVGRGRLSDVEEIVDACEKARSPRDFEGSHVVITAGPTRETIDPVRFISNRSSGKMGYALARSASRRGANVTLITGPTSLPVPYGVTVHRVVSALEMHERLLSVIEELPSTSATNFVFMVAAVTDFRPKTPSTAKLKTDKRTEFDLPLSPNPDIVGELGAVRRAVEERKKISLKLVGFSVETGELEEMLLASREKLENKKLDMIVANFAEDAFEKDTNRVWLIDRFGHRDAVTIADKPSVAERVLTAALRL